MVSGAAFPRYAPCPGAGRRNRVARPGHRFRPGSAPAAPDGNALRVAATEVSVVAPARLHMGFFGLQGGGQGRCFGSLGLALTDLALRLRVRRAPRLQVRGPMAGRVREVVESLRAHLDLPQSMEIVVERAIPPHMGLGSGTQLALAVGSAVLRLHGMRMPPAELAALLGRGERSGIGVGAFRYGGLLADGGSGAATVVPPVVSRLEFPEEWRLLLMLDHSRHGLSGARERRSLESLPDLPMATVSRLCRLVLLQALPAVCERRIQDFGAAVGEIQQILGGHFAAVQGGSYTSPEVAAAMRWLVAEGAAGVGQSSWGSTGFALFASEEQASGVLRQGLIRWRGHAQLELRMVSGRNRGAEIEGGEPAAGLASSRRPAC